MTEPKNIMVVGPASTTERIEREEEAVEVGQWYWVKSDKNPKGKSRLACIMHIGSNFVKLENPHFPRHGNYHVWRIHFDDIPIELKRELNPQDAINQKVLFYKTEVSKYINKVKEITSRLGVGESLAIGMDTTETKALVVISGQEHIKNYESSLVKAKEKDLPELFKKIEKSNEQLARWMSAETLPMEAMVGGLSGTIKKVEERIFKVSLYSGLTEFVVHCASGERAPIDTKLHIMQRRLYMDEECLLNYRHGGMSFRSIEKFDKWLTRPKNRDRILPFPRCLVAMKIRRKEKDRWYDGTLDTALINFQLGELDKKTFLYIRNGKNVYRMNCDLDFGETIFPNKGMFDPTTPMMFTMFGDRIDEMITVHDYKERVKKKRLSKRWEKANPDKGSNKNPYRGSSLGYREWTLFDQDNVYYDECMKQITDKINQYNRIVLIIQGLLDRSEVLHPHPPVQTWTPEGFNAAIKLIYDSATLYQGEQPDFDSFFKFCNKSLKKDSVVIGQDCYWEEREAERENARTARSWREKTSYHKTFRPYGNPGPGYISRMHKWQPRARKALFVWFRERQGYRRWGAQGDIRSTVAVPGDRLFNVSAYKLGDFKQFFADPRTREQYIKWAPMLLTAEEFHAGNIKLTPRESL